MDATTRVNETFNRVLARGLKRLSKASRAEQILFYIVATRCEIDIDGFSSVFEQQLKEKELERLIDGLRSIGEEELAKAFDRGRKLLKREKFYDHLNWNKVSSRVERQIEAIGEEVGDRMWKLDDKLASLLDAD